MANDNNNNDNSNDDNINNKKWLKIIKKWLIIINTMMIKKNNNNNNNSKYTYYWYFIHTDQNRHPSTEHDQYKVAGSSSTCYTGIVQQTSHPQGKMGKVTGSFFTKQ